MGRKRVVRLMRKMGLTPIYQKPNTSKPQPGHKVYPYLLRGVEITEPAHVWFADISYIPMRRGFLYLVAVMDWASRKVLSRRLSNFLDVDFCVAALREAMDRFPKPLSSTRIKEANSRAWTSLSCSRMLISKFPWMDNVMIELL